MDITKFSGNVHKSGDSYPIGIKYTNNRSGSIISGGVITFTYTDINGNPIDPSWITIEADTLGVGTYTDDVWTIGVSANSIIEGTFNVVFNSNDISTLVITASFVASGITNDDSDDIGKWEFSGTPASNLYIVSNGDVVGGFKYTTYSGEHTIIPGTSSVEVIPDFGLENAIVEAVLFNISEAIVPSGTDTSLNYTLGNTFGATANAFDIGFTLNSKFSTVDPIIIPEGTGNYDRITFTTSPGNEAITSGKIQYVIVMKEPVLIPDI